MRTLFALLQLDNSSIADTFIYPYIYICRNPATLRNERELIRLASYLLMKGLIPAGFGPDLQHHLTLLVRQYGNLRPRIFTKMVTPA